MFYETATVFLMDVIICGEMDDLSLLLLRIVVGCIVDLGMGLFFFKYDIVWVV